MQEVVGEHCQGSDIEAYQLVNLIGRQVDKLLMNHRTGVIDQYIDIGLVQFLTELPDTSRVSQVGRNDANVNFVRKRCLQRLEFVDSSCREHKIKDALTNPIMPMVQILLRI